MNDEEFNKCIDFIDAALGNIADKLNEFEKRISFIEKQLNPNLTQNRALAEMDCSLS